MISLLHDTDLNGKRVLLRADMNVPLEGGHIISDFRLEAIRPTLDLLVKKGARTTIITHIGRPQAQEKTLSTEHLVTRFTDNGYSLEWVASLEEAHQKSISLAPGNFLLLENLRFFKDELTHGAGSIRYAKQLADLGDYYINDAWALVHKDDVSITSVPKLFSPSCKSIGLLIEHELSHLQPLLTPKRPFVLIMGGSKITQKLPLIEKALEIADTIIVLPALAFTFLQAQGKEVGRSLVEGSVIEKAKKILLEAKEKNVELILPQDFTVARPDLSGPIKVATVIPQGMTGIAVGPESLRICNEVIRTSASLFLNGTMGFFERPETLEPQKELLQSIAQTDTYSVVGGGDSVAAVKLFNLGSSLSFCSTGGGATLHYILYKSAPALDYLPFE